MSRRYDRILIDNKTAQHEAGYFTVAECAQGNEFGFDVEFDATSASGVVTIETAADNIYHIANVHYAGTWAILATVTWTGAADKSYHVAVAGSYRALRARIATAVGSGFVTVRGTINGNPT